MKGKSNMTENSGFSYKDVLTEFGKRKLHSVTITFSIR